MAVIKAVSSKASIGKAINYVTKEEKTEERLISGKDCNPNTAIEEMKMTKELYGKTEGRQYKHYIQSFSKSDDITPQKAHDIAREWAEKNFKGHEVVIATHKDKDHIHSHFIVNSVNFENGRKIQESRKDLKELKEQSDKICEREGLSVIKEPFAKIRYTQAERSIIEKGGVSWKDEIREVVDLEKTRSKSFEDFKQRLQNDYGIKVNERGQNISYKHPDHLNPVRGKTLGKDYERNSIEYELDKKIGNREEVRTERDNTRTDQQGTRVDWGAVESNVKGQPSGVSKFTGNEITGNISLGVQAINTAVQSAMGKGTAENQQSERVERLNTEEHGRAKKRDDEKARTRTRSFEQER